MKTESKILIVEDNPDNRSILVHYYRNFGLKYEIFLATNGKQGLEVVQEKNPNLIVSDWDMPEMNGIDFVKNLRKLNLSKRIPVIMLSGVMTTVANLRTAFEAGVYDYVRKPVSSGELLARTHSALEFAKYYNQLIELKEQELFRVSNTILQQQSTLNKLKQKILKVRNDCKNGEAIDCEEIEEITGIINVSLKTEAWKQFEKYFTAINPDFHSILASKHPNLSPAEIKLCTLLRLNLATKEIASLICLTTDSVRVSRTRLRNKLGLKGQAQLVAYLMSL